MKKLLLLLVICLYVYNGYSSVNGGGNIPLTVMWDNSSDSHNPVSKDLLPPLSIFQKDHTLSFPVISMDYVLQLCDENNSVAYSVYIPAGTAQVILPSTLSGDFEIRLVPFGFTYYYRGYIIL